MKISDLEKLVTKLRAEFGQRIDDAQISIRIDEPDPFKGKLRWNFGVSDVCVDRLSIWSEDTE